MKPLALWLMPASAVLATLCLIASPSAERGLLATQRASAPLLPVTFAHADHTNHNCAQCHHNFTDSTGQGFCYDCHKTDPDIASLIEPMFHGLCRDCHVELAHQGEPHGPVRACQACHVPDMRP